jgi:methyl-accepting chemotaxis protein
MPASEPLEFAPRKYKQPQTEELPETERLPVAELTALAPRDGLEMTDLGDLVDQVFENSTGEIASLIDEFERLRRKLKTNGESIKRRIEEHRALSQQATELTKTISGSVEKVRASVDG